MTSIPADAEAILRRYRTCEFTTFGKDGAPSTWPLCARWLPDGRFLLTTSIGLPQKAFNIRRNPQVSLSFSEPTGSGVSKPGAVLVLAHTGAAQLRSLHRQQLLLVQEDAASSPTCPACQSSRSTSARPSSRASPPGR